MKNFVLLPTLMFCLAAGLWAEDDCAKSADACKPQIKKLTPFMAELKKAEKTPELKQGSVKEIALKQGAVKETALKQGAAKEPAQKETLSKPAWLLVIGALLAGLYYFLKEGKAKRKRA